MAFHSDGGIHKFTMNGFDASQLVAKADIYHSVSHKIPGLYGKIRFADMTGALSKNDALYQHKVPISIAYGDAMGKNVKEFTIMSAGLSRGKYSDSMRGMAHDLMVCSEGFFNAPQIIQHSSIGQTASDVIKTLHDQYLHPGASLDAVATKILAQTEHYLINNIPVMDAIHGIRQRSVTTDKYRSNSLLLFLNHDGKYIFKSLEEMLDKAMSTDLYIAKPGADGNPNLDNQDRLAATAVDFHMAQDRPSYWSATQQAGGAPDNRLFNIHAMEYKPAETKAYDPSSTYSKVASPYGAKPQKPMIIHNPIYDKQLSGDVPPNVDKAQASLQQRAAQGSPYATVNLNSLEANINVGEGIHVHAPQPSGDTEGEGESSQSGHYLVLHTRHSIDMGASQFKTMQSVSGIQTSRA